MTYQFAQPETGYELMGDKLWFFNPGYDYFYKPLSQSIMTDESKSTKIKEWTSILQVIANSPHPDMPLIFNYILAQIVVLMGDEFVNFSDKFLSPEEPLQVQNQGSPQGEQGMMGGPSNQYLLPQPDMEVMTREGMNV